MEQLTTDWALDELAAGVMKLLPGDWMFSATELRKVAEALSNLGTSPPFPTWQAFAKSPEYAALQLLHCTSVQDMKPSSIAGMPAAILRGLGLADPSRGAEIFGAERWRTICAHYSHFAKGPTAALQSRSRGNKGDADNVLVVSFLRDGK